MKIMIKKDVCLWPSHKQEAVAHLFPLGGSVRITHGEQTHVVGFVPMNGATGLKPSAETPEGKAFWAKLPYGTEVQIQQG